MSHRTDDSTAHTSDSIWSAVDETASDGPPCGTCQQSCTIRHEMDGGGSTLGDSLAQLRASDSGILLSYTSAVGHRSKPSRLTTPQIRNGRGELEGTDWPKALHLFVERMKGIQGAHGPDAIAVLALGSLSLEETAFLGGLVRSGLRTSSLAGFPAAASVAAVAREEAFGFDAPSACYRDLELADTIVLVNTNLSQTHPDLWERVHRNPNHPTIVVVDSRRTDTSAQADLHLPIHPHSEAILLHSIGRELVERDWINADYVTQHTSGFSALAAHIEQFTIDVACRETRLSAGLIEHLVELIHRGDRVMFVWSSGSDAAGNREIARAVTNLALMTGQIGRPGTGVLTCDEPCSAGADRLFSNRHSLWGGRSFSDPLERLQAASISGIPAKLLPETGASSYEQVVEGLQDGSIRGLWIVGSGSGAVSSSHPELAALLGTAEFLAVQETRENALGVSQAHVVFPSAEWTEKKGTVITPERRLKFLTPSEHPPGDALTDFVIFRLLADAWGCGRTLRKWNSPAGVFELLKKLSAHRPCDFSGIVDHDMLVTFLGIQWPFTGSEGSDGGEAASGDRRLFEGGRYFHPDQKARFTFDSPHQRKDREHHLLQFDVKPSTDVAAEGLGDEPRGLREPPPEWAAARIVLLLNPVDADFWSLTERELIRLEMGPFLLQGVIRFSDAIPSGQIGIPSTAPFRRLWQSAISQPLEAQVRGLTCHILSGGLSIQDPAA